MDEVFAFLGDHAPLHFGLIFAHLDLFLVGLWTTVQLTGLSLLIAGALAVPLSLVRAYRVPVLNPLVWGYTYLFRGTPLLVQLYLVYYGLGQIEAVREGWLWDPLLSQAWWCALITFALNSAAYTTELLRGAIVATPRGEVEAARACAMPEGLIRRRIVLPGAFRRALPAYANEVIFMLHGSAVASTITLMDLLGAGRWLNRHYYVAYEGFVTAAVFYMALVFLITRAFAWLERRMLGHLQPASPPSPLGAFRL